MAVDNKSKEAMLRLYGEEKSTQENKEHEGEDDEIYCGVGDCRPGVMQKCTNIGCVTLALCFAGLSTSTLNIYINSQITTLERQFGFSSSVSGILMSCNDFGYLLTTLIMSYLARRVHIPRALGLSTILFGVLNVLAAAGGTLLGGFVTSRFKWSPLTCLKFMVGVTILSAGFVFTGFFLGCDQPVISMGASMRLYDLDLFRFRYHAMFFSTRVGQIVLYVIALLVAIFSRNPFVGHSDRKGMEPTIQAEGGVVE
nr:hypothetical protein BaRGS_018205 [Batillaria attramentaria]